MLYKKLIYCTIVVVGLLIGKVATADEIVKVASFARQQGELIEVLIRFDIKHGWHIFAPYIQEFGSPLEIRIAAPQESEVLEASFSRPKRFDWEDFSYDGYARRAYYKVTLQVPSTEQIVINTSWQACADECVFASKQVVSDEFNFIDFNQELACAEKDFLPEPPSDNYRAVIVILMALGGGMLLNLMPCIFPVLSFKVLALAKQSNEDRRKEAGFYSLGVVLSMVALATLLLLLRQGGSMVGWGFQMQSPWFVGAMLILFVVLTLMMLDVFKLNGGIFNGLATKQFGGKNFNSFMTGLMAVLIATPCSAPLMGAAIGYALLAPLWWYYPIFIALGIGYALPFGLLMYFPKVVQCVLPRSGKWMNVFKKVLSIPLILTCMWLCWVLSGQLGVTISGKNILWHPYSQVAVTSALKEKRPVFIDFTARWCLTCLMNKKTTLQSDELAKLVKDKNILMLRADVTNHEREASAGLALYGRGSVPLYVYYDGKSEDYLILPQILTPSVIREYLQ